MRGNERRDCQIGDFWLSKKPGRQGENDPFCRTWYDDSTRQTRRISLGTADVHTATKLLAEWVTLNDRPHEAPDKDVLIETILMTYWKEHAECLPSNSHKGSLAKWQQYWEGRTVADITPAAQKKFQEWLRGGKLKTSSVDRILSVGRAALNYARKQRILGSEPPVIFMIETHSEKLSREKMGIPILPSDMARFFAAIEHRHIFVLALLAATTLARPEAMLDLTRSQYDEQNDRVDLNLRGRIQTKKYRPTLPVAPTLRPWLKWETDPSAHYVTTRGGKPFQGYRELWEKARQKADLPSGVTPYSFRHGMAREMGKRGVPLDQISYFLGHRIPGSQTTLIYAPYDPSYCKDAVAAIEAVMEEIRGSIGSAKLDDPAAEFERTRRKYDRLDPAMRQRMLDLLAEGRSPHWIAKKIGVSPTAVYKRARTLEGMAACQLRAGEKLLRGQGSDNA